MTASVDGAQVEIAEISGPGANDAELRALLGAPGLKCRLVRRASIFYLPFDANTS